MTSKVLVPNFSDIAAQVAKAARRASLSPGIDGYVHQDHQIAFHKSTALIKLFLGGNRAGKTVAGASDLVWKVTGRHPYNQKFKPPLRTRAIGVDLEEGLKKIIIPELARWMPPSELKNGSWEDSYVASSRTLTLLNGSFIEFMSYEQAVEKFAGTSRHAVWFDEEPPEEIFNENLLRLLDVEGECALTMTPLIDMSWTYDRLFQRGISGGKFTLPDGTEYSAIDVFQASVFDNAYVNANMVAVITDGMSEEEKMARTDGKYFSFTGTIYANAIQPETYIDSIVGTPDWEPIYKTWSFFGFLDHGFTNPTAYYVAAANNKGTVVVFYEYYMSGRLVKENAAHIKDIHKELKLEGMIKYIVGDPSISQKNAVTGTSIQTEYAENGVYISLGNNDVQAGIQRVARFFKTKKLFITRNCEKLIWELQRYRWARYDTSKARNKNNLKEEPLKKDDHAVDALRYGIMSRPQAPTEEPIIFGNVLGAPTVASDYDESIRRKDEYAFPSGSYYDPDLGTDW